MQLRYSVAGFVGLAALVMAGAASAQDFSFNVTATSDYVWRGVSQSDEDFAIQGGADFESGIFYAGAWASTGLGRRSSFMRNQARPPMAAAPSSGARPSTKAPWWGRSASPAGPRPGL